MTGVATDFDVAEVVDLDRGFLVGGWVMVVCVATGVAATFVFWLVHRTLIDDAYITLDYARNLAFHLHWGIVRAKTANSATSPLFVALIGAATALTRNAMLGLGIVFVAAWVALAGWVTRATLTLELPLVSAVLAIALVLVNPFLLSVTGMETTLIVALLAGLVCYAIQGRAIAFGVVAGLGVLTRADVIIFVAVVTLATPVMRRAIPRIAVVMAAVAGPWFVWSWVHFGSAIPDTFILKTLQHRFGPYSFANGARFWASVNATATVISFVPVVLGIVVLVAWAAARLVRNTDTGGRLNPVAALGAAGIAYYLAYSALGVPPYQWYYGPTIAALSISMALLMPEVWRSAARLEASRTSLRAGLGASLGTASVALVVFANAALVVGHGVPWRGEPVIFANWATPAEYARIGKQLRILVGDRAVASPGEIGTLAYFCDCTIVDAFADRGLVVPEVERRVAPASAVTKLIFHLNFRYLDRRILPQVVTYALVRLGGHTRSPSGLNIDSRVVGPWHIELQRLNLDAHVISDFARAVVASLTPGTGPVIVGADTGLLAGTAYQDALAVELRRRGVTIRLDPFGAHPFAPRRLYNDQPIRAAFTVASGDATDTLLARRGTSLVAYAGAVSWVRRSAIEAQLHNLDATHRAGRLSNLDYFFQTVGLRAALGDDLAIVSVPFPR